MIFKKYIVFFFFWGGVQRLILGCVVLVVPAKQGKASVFQASFVQWVAKKRVVIEVKFGIMETQGVAVTGWITGSPSHKYHFQVVEPDPPSGQMRKLPQARENNKKHL